VQNSCWENIFNWRQIIEKLLLILLEILQPKSLIMDDDKFHKLLFNIDRIKLDNAEFKPNMHKYINIYKSIHSLVSELMGKLRQL
jgi:hypothetical protein